MATAEKFPKEQELYRVLSQCAYRNHNHVANDAANILFNYPKLFSPLITQTSEQGVIKQLLDLKGELPIKYKGQTYSIITSIQFPFIYPDAPAVIRIYNPDNQKFSVNQYFIQGASQDQSVVNIHNQDLQNWYHHKSIARVMVTLVRELESYFPFFMRQQQPMSIIPPQNPGAQTRCYQPQPQAYGQYSESVPNYHNQPYTDNVQNYHNPPYNPYVQNQANYQQSNMAQIEYKLKEKCNQILSEELNQISNDYKTLHQHHDKLIDEIIKQETKKTYLNSIESQIDQSISLLGKENKVLYDFVEKNDILELNEETLSKSVKETDQFSTQILDMYSDIQACKETLHFIVTKFKNFDMPFETLIKLTRKFSEEQFNNIVLLKKCTQSQKKI